MINARHDVLESAFCLSIRLDVSSLVNLFRVQFLGANNNCHWKIEDAASSVLQPCFCDFDSTIWPLDLTDTLHHGDDLERMIPGVRGAATIETTPNQIVTVFPGIFISTPLLFRFSALHLGRWYGRLRSRTLPRAVSFVSACMRSFTLALCGLDAGSGCQLRLARFCMFLRRFLGRRYGFTHWILFPLERVIHIGVARRDWNTGRIPSTFTLLLLQYTPFLFFPLYSSIRPGPVAAF